MPREHLNLEVTSHVARDLLQSAGVFQHEQQVVWEYVSNGLQYVDPGNAPEVHVHVPKNLKSITISDNGAGMDWDGLKNFFVMHGENIDRKKGAPGRGYFGTGKSAAFGIANNLQITTVRNGRQYTVVLNRKDIENMESGDPIPVSVIENGIDTETTNGTIVKIDDVRLRSIDIDGIIKYIERHIARWPGATVFVNNHLCEYQSPPVSKEYTFPVDEHEFPCLPSSTVLTINVAKRPLDKHEQGVAIIAGGLWHETTLAGEEKKEFANYIFGELVIDHLDTVDSLPAFDMSRSMKLNRKHPVVADSLAFIGRAVSTVRRQLIEEDRKRKQSEEAQRLEKKADEIANIINEDFNRFRARLQQTVARMHGGKDLASQLKKNDEESSEHPLIEGGEQAGSLLMDHGAEGHTGDQKGQAPTGPPDGSPELERDPAGLRLGSSANKATNKSKSGGFSVQFMDMGSDEDRAKYSRDDRTIFINLQHPQIATAKESVGTNNPAFLRLAYEVAFTEYAIALAYEQTMSGFFIDAYEPIGEVRRTINRLTRTGAHMYAIDR